MLILFHSQRCKNSSSLGYSTITYVFSCNFRTIISTGFQCFRVIQFFIIELRESYLASPGLLRNGLTQKQSGIVYCLESGQRERLQINFFDGISGTSAAQRGDKGQGRERKGPWPFFLFAFGHSRAQAKANLLLCSVDCS